MPIANFRENGDIMVGDGNSSCCNRRSCLCGAVCPPRMHEAKQALGHGANPHSSASRWSFPAHQGAEMSTTKQGSPGGPATPEEVTIIRYPNRRLYDRSR